jgi:hypothetical protein
VDWVSVVRGDNMAFSNLYLGLIMFKVTPVEEEDGQQPFSGNSPICYLSLPVSLLTFRDDGAVGNDLS